MHRIIRAGFIVATPVCHTFGRQVNRQAGGCIPPLFRTNYGLKVNYFLVFFSVVCKFTSLSLMKFYYCQSVIIDWPTPNVNYLQD